MTEEMHRVRDEQGSVLCQGWNVPSDPGSLGGDLSPNPFVLLNPAEL